MRLVIPLPRLSVLVAAQAFIPLSGAASENLFFTEFPIVASVSRLPQPLSETPASVTVIDQEMIRASGMRTVEDLLRLVPGFQVTSHNKDPAIVAYHGLNSGMSTDEYGPRVQVLVDGRSQYSPLFKSGVNWNLLPVALENIERIEVTRGSNSVSYGSNAFMGVVNIITLDATQTQGWMLASNQGNNGINDNTLRWGGRVGEAQVRFTARQLNDGGFRQGFYSNAWHDDPDDRTTTLFDLKADYQLGNRDELSLTANLVQDVSGYGRPVNNANDPIRDFDQSSGTLGLAWHHIGDGGHEYLVRYNYTADKASGAYSRAFSFDTNTVDGSGKVIKAGPFQLEVDPGGESTRHELEFEHIIAPGGAWRMVYGGGLRSVELTAYGQFTRHSTQHRHAGRIFGNLEYRPAEAWLFNAGLSLERDSRVGWMADPRLSLSYHISPQHTLRIGASQAHRNPSLYELAGFIERRDPTTGLADIAYYAPGVEPEKIRTLEIGYLGEFKRFNASADVRGFIERIPNHIQIVPLALPASLPDDHDTVFGRTTYNFPYGRADGAANIIDLTIKGVEYQLRWQPWHGARLIYSSAAITIDAEYTGSQSVADDSGNTEKIITQTASSAPRLSQSAMLIQKLPYDFTASLMYYRIGEMRWRRNDREGSPLPMSERLDWRIAKGFRIGSSRGELAYTVQMANGFGEQYGRNLSRLADRMHWLTLRVDL